MYLSLVKFPNVEVTQQEFHIVSTAANREITLLCGKNTFHRNKTTDRGQEKN